MFVCEIDSKYLTKRLILEVIFVYYHQLLKRSQDRIRIQHCLKFPRAVAKGSNLIKPFTIWLEEKRKRARERNEGTYLYSLYIERIRRGYMRLESI